MTGLPNPKAIPLPGMEDLVSEPPTEDYQEGSPSGISKRYYDTASFPDAPGNQSPDKQPFILYVTFPTRDDFVRGILALTLHERAGGKAGVREATIDAVHPGKRGRALLEVWEERLKEDEHGNNISPK